MSSIIRPPLAKTRMRLDSSTASPTSWVTKTTVLPVSFHIWWSSARSVRAVMASRWLNGSSMNSTSGSVLNARAMPTRCCMPPESSPGYFLALSPSCTISRYLWQRARVASERSSCTNRRLSRTVRQGSSRAAWKT